MSLTEVTSRGKFQGSNIWGQNVRIPTSLRVAVMICATLVNTRTHTQSHKQKASTWLYY